MDNDEYLGTTKLAALLNVSTMSLYRWEKSIGDFPAPTRINGRKYWSRRQISEWMASRAA